MLVHFLVVTAAALAALLLSSGPACEFDSGSCARLRENLAHHVLGQDLAMQQITSAICDHIHFSSPPGTSSPSHLDGGAQSNEPGKPLVLSLHGPPGVGKSFMHFVAARSLYNITAMNANGNGVGNENGNSWWRTDEGECPGTACPAYKVIFGLDYTLRERDAQSQALVQKVLDHLSVYSDALIVVEEYDKLDCHSRGVLRQIFDKASAATHNVTMDRAIFVLESNTGYGKIVQALQATEDNKHADGDADDNGADAGAGQAAEDGGFVDAESLQYTLKNMMFRLWQQDGCEEHSDTVKTLSLIDMFVPFLPLGRDSIHGILGHHIQKRVDVLNQGLRGRGAPTMEVAVAGNVLAFLSGKMEWDGGFAVEGAKEVTTAIRRHVFMPLYDYALQLKPVEQGQATHRAVELVVDRATNRLVLRDVLDAEAVVA